MRLPHQEIDHAVKKNMGKGLEIFVFVSVRIRKWFCLFFLYAGWASQRPKEKKKKKLGQAWRLSLMVSENTMRASNPALKQPALYCWRSRWHSQGDSTDELPNVSMHSRVVPFATDPAKAMILSIISHSWVHTGVGARSRSCSVDLPGGSWLRPSSAAHSEPVVRPFSWAEMGSLYSLFCKNNVSLLFIRSNRLWHDRLVLHRLIFPQAMVPELLVPLVWPQNKSLIIIESKTNSSYYLKVM